MKLRMTLPVLIIATTLEVILATNLVHVELPEAEYPGGVCNDGTRAGYFHDTDVSKQGKKVHVGLNGGALCDSKEACLDRCDRDHDGEVDNHLCTADNRTSINTNNIFFSPDQKNPLHDYWHVKVPYCTSDTWAGGRNPSEETNGYAFHGKTVFRNVMNHLSHHFNLFEATHFVLTGESAGGFGVGLNCDDVAEWLHSNNPNMDVKCIADSPDFIAPEVHGVDCPKREPGYQATLQDFWQREDDHSCWQWATNPENQIEDPADYCGILTTAIQHVHTPLFVLVPLLDSTISRGQSCFTPGTSATDDILAEEWREAMVAHIAQAVETHPGGRLGFWSPNCYHHVLGNIMENVYVSDINNPEISLNGLQAITNWMEDSGPYVMVDSPSKANVNCPHGK